MELLSKALDPTIDRNTLPLSYTKLPKSILSVRSVLCVYFESTSNENSFLSRWSDTLQQHLSITVKFETPAQLYFAFLKILISNSTVLTNQTFADKLLALQLGIDALLSLNQEDAFTEKEIHGYTDRYAYLEQALLWCLVDSPRSPWIPLLKKSWDYLAPIAPQYLNTPDLPDLIASYPVELITELIESRILNRSETLSRTVFQSLSKSSLPQRELSNKSKFELISKLFDVTARRKRQKLAAYLLSEIIFTERSVLETVTSKSSWNATLPEWQSQLRWTRAWRKLMSDRITLLSKEIWFEVPFLLLSYLRSESILELLFDLCRSVTLTSRVWLVLLLNAKRTEGYITKSMVARIWEHHLEYLETDSIGVYLRKGLPVTESSLFLSLRCFLYDLSKWRSGPIRFGNHEAVTLSKYFSVNLYLYEYLRTQKQHDLSVSLKELIVSQIESLNQTAESFVGEEQALSLSEWPESQLCRALIASTLCTDSCVPPLPYSVILELYLKNKLLVNYVLLTRLEQPSDYSVRQTYYNVHSLALQAVTQLSALKTELEELLRRKIQETEQLLKEEKSTNKGEGDKNIESKNDRSVDTAVDESRPITAMERKKLRITQRGEETKGEKKGRR